MKMTGTRVTNILLSLIAFCSISLSQVPEGYEKGLSTISKEQLMNNISFLASDSLKGRFTGEQGNLIAAMFIAQKFKDYGLQPVFTSGKKAKKKEEKKKIISEENDETEVNLDLNNQSEYDEYFQKFTLKKSKLCNNNRFCVINSYDDISITKNFDYLNDFLIQYEVPKNINLSAPVVFAGYGIAKGEKGYNDYIDENGKEIDVKNKIVLMFDGHPGISDSASSFTKAHKPYYTNPLRKAEVAAEKGAAAIIVVNSLYKNDPPISIKYSNLIDSFSKDIFSLPGLPSAKIPIIYITKDVLDEIFKDAGKNYNEIMKTIEDSLKTFAFEIQNKKISFEINFESELIKTQNVIGYIPGSDPKLKNECVIIGAHFDHVGIGKYGTMDTKYRGQIHNGADDNASGTVGVIELAEAFSKNPPKRSLLFIGFTAEDVGIFGSRYYAYLQPVIPLEKTIAMLNLDMISRNSTDYIYIGGAFYSTDLMKMVERANKLVGFELLYNIGLLNKASDQAPFLRKEIPAAFFFAGDHEDYHTPNDDVDKINPDKLEKTTKLAYLSGWIVANENTKPTFNELSIEQRAVIVKESSERSKKFKK